MRPSNIIKIIGNWYLFIVFVFLAGTSTRILHTTNKSLLENKPSDKIIIGN